MTTWIIAIVAYAAGSAGISCLVFRYVWGNWPWEVQS